MFRVDIDGDRLMGMYRSAYKYYQKVIIPGAMNNPVEDPGSVAFYLGEAVRVGKILERIEKDNMESPDVVAVEGWESVLEWREKHGKN